MILVGQAPKAKYSGTREAVTRFRKMSSFSLVEARMRAREIPPQFNKVIKGLAH